MSLTESFTVTKPNVNLDVEISSGTCLSQNTFNEGISRGTRNTNLASDTEAKNTATGKTSEQPSGFSATDAIREKSSRKRRLEADSESKFSEKEDDEYADFKRFCFVQSQNMMILSGIFQKIWPSTQMIISTNLLLKKIYRKAF